jgi:osmotically-inducible protein OsmY
MSERSPNPALIRRIEQQLAQAGLQVAVESSDGTLTLSGIVETEESRQAALDIARAIAPDARIDDDIEVESILPTEIDDFASDDPTAELADSREEILKSGGEIDPDFTDRPGLSDAFAASGAVRSLEEDLAESGEAYTPPIDPVVTTGPHGEARVLGGFEIDSEEDVEVDASASDRHPGDEALADAVRRELAEDSATTDLNLVVAVRNGVAHLRGEVADLDDAENAEAVAARVPGIRDVIDEIDVAGL